MPKYEYKSWIIESEYGKWNVLNELPGEQCPFDPNALFNGIRFLLDDNWEIVSIVPRSTTKSFCQRFQVLCRREVSCLE